MAEKKRDEETATPAFPEAGAFFRALSALRASQAEQILIERTIGQAVLAKMGKKQPSLTAIYQKLGGSDPVVLEVLAHMGKVVADLPVDKAVQLDQLGKVAANVINLPGTVAAKSSAIAIGNPLWDPVDTALHTLAELGGDPFKQRFHIR